MKTYKSNDDDNGNGKDKQRTAMVWQFISACRKTNPIPRAALTSSHSKAMSSSSLKQQIASAFRSVNAGAAPLPPSVLSQVAALSTSLRISPAELAEAWEAHSLNKNVSVLDDASFGGYRNALAAKHGGGVRIAKNVAVIASTGLGKRSAPGGRVTPSPAAKRPNAPVNTPATANADRKGPRDGLSAVDGIATPSGRRSASPSKAPGSAASVITPPKQAAAPKAIKYADRTNAGQLVTSYNPHDLPTAAELLAGESEEERERIAAHRGAAISLHPAANHPRGTFRHMFAPIEKRSGALDERLNSMSDAICEAYNIKSEEEEMVDCMDGVKDEGGAFSTWTPVGIPKQCKVLCVGRICNEAHEGRLNRASIRLEGDRINTHGSRIQLDLKGLDEQGSPEGYSFFPGQIVAVEGINSSGRTMRASRLLEGVPPPRETLPKSELLEHQHGPDRQDSRPLSIVSLCGPFTARDNLEYDPLLDAVSRVSQDKPDVVIMCGPFVDARQPLIAGGEPVLQDEDGSEAKVGCERVFAVKVAGLLEEMYALDPKLRTQFVLVPSLDDAFADAVYPQPPFEDRIAGIKVPKGMDAGDFCDLGLRNVELAGRENDAKALRDPSRRRVHLVPNPCTLQINDVTVGVTSSDVLLHISKDECNGGLPPGTRLARIASHLVRQRSYYPLFPAAAGASLDLGRAKEWEMPVQPDLLILPSRLASFARAVCDTTVVVNPGELTKGAAGGTYAVVDIHSMKRGALEANGGVKREGAPKNVVEDGSDMLDKGMQHRVRVDIKRI